MGSDGATACVKIVDDQVRAKNRTRRPKGRTQGRGELRVQSDLRACEELGEVMGQEDGGDQ